MPAKPEKHRVQVIFTPGQWKIIESFKGELGDGDSEVVRNIVLAWLSEKSVISSTVKSRMGLK
ncbi:MAG: CopG family transcriptional regulator [Candidatus Thermoplasmatota archaeon]